MLSHLIKYIPNLLHIRGSRLVVSFIKANSVYLLILFANFSFCTGHVYAEWDKISWKDRTMASKATTTFKETDIGNSMNVGAAYNLSDVTQFIISADLDRQPDYLYSDNDDIAVGGTLTASHRFGKEKTGTKARAKIATAYIDSQYNSGDGQAYSIDFEIEERLNDRADLKIGYTYDYKESSDSPVFEQQGHKGSADMNLIVSENTLLTLGYTVHDGDIPSTDYHWVTPSDYMASGIIESNYLFPAGLYSMQGTTHIFEIDLNHDFYQKNASLNLGYQYKNGQFSQFNYSTNLLLASLNYKY